MSKHLKTIYAGRLIMQALYTVSSGSVYNQRERAGKLKITSEAQRKLNHRYSYQKLAGILANNFPKGSDVVTLTYSEACKPKDRKRVEADVKAFRAKAAKHWKRKGKPFLMAWSIEHKHGDGRWHVHAVINKCGGNDRAVVQSLWSKGSVELKALRTDREKNHIGLAVYMTKEADDQGNSRHVWHVTKNCRKPETDVQTGIPDKQTLQAPKGAMILEQESHSNEYGSWSYIKYYIPEDAPPKTQRNLRRKNFI